MPHIRTHIRTHIVLVCMYVFVLVCLYVFVCLCEHAQAQAIAAWGFVLGRHTLKLKLITMEDHPFSAHPLLPSSAGSGCASVQHTQLSCPSASNAAVPTVPNLPTTVHLHPHAHLWRRLLWEPLVFSDVYGQIAELTRLRRQAVAMGMGSEKIREFEKVERQIRIQHGLLSMPGKGRLILRSAAQPLQV